MKSSGRFHRLRQRSQRVFAEEHGDAFEPGTALHRHRRRGWRKGAHPFTTPTGRRRATRPARPAASQTRATSLTSL